MFFGFLFFLSLLMITSSAKEDCYSTRCKVDSTSLRFFVLGDWGGQSRRPYYTRGQIRVSKTLQQLNKIYDSQFILGIGDNMYGRGVDEETSSRFINTFENVYQNDGRPWYLIGGNHDYMSDSGIDAQIEYSKISDRWNFPSPYYTLLYELSDGTTIDIIMIDTVILCGVDSHGIKQTDCDAKVKRDKHVGWIKKRLYKSTSDYLLVVGHYPIYSISRHGPNECLEELGINRYVVRYGVTAYISGHDHGLQHIVPTNYTAPVHYIVSGAASRLDESIKYIDKVPKDFVRYRFPEDGFDYEGKHYTEYGGLVYINITMDQSTAVFYKEDGKLLYQTDIGLDL